MLTKVLKGFYDRKGTRYAIPTPEGDPTGQGYDDSELRDLIAAKADKNHTHTGYAAVDHAHSSITSSKADIVLQEDSGAGKIFISVADSEGNEEDATINYGNIDNLSRALTNPDSSPTSGSGNLITSGAVYTALSGKAASTHTHEIADVNGLSTALSEAAIHPSDSDYLIICKNYTSDPSVPDYPTSVEYSQTIECLNGFVVAHASELVGDVVKYIPCVVELKTASASPGSKILAIVKINNINSSDDLNIEVYVGTNIFSIYGEEGAQGYTWKSDSSGSAVEGWTKTSFSSF